MTDEEMEKVKLITKDGYPWEKPLYLCLWADSSCLGYPAPIHWLKHEGKGFDLVGIGNDGTLILCEVKAQISTEKDGEDVAGQVSAHRDAMRDYLAQSTWKGMDPSGVIGDEPLGFMDYKNYGIAFKEAGWGNLLAKALELKPDPDSVPDFSGRLLLLIVANGIKDSGALALIRHMRGLVDGQAVVWPTRVEFMLSEVEVLSTDGKPSPSVKWRRGKQWLLR